MLATLTRAYVVAGVVVTSAGCTKPQPKSSMLIAGSTTMKAYLQPLVVEFAKKEPNLNVVSDTGGGAAGIVALKREAIDIATLARDLKPKEDGNDLRNYLIARDGIGILVNVGNPVSTLTFNQVRDIYEQKITSWRQVGGEDAKIEVITREPTSKAERSLRDLVLGGDDMPKGHQVNSRTEMITAVKSSRHAIGFGALAALTSDTKCLEINGVSMNRETVLTSRYPLSRSFYLVVSGVAAPAAERFVAYALSKEGQELFAKDGLIPVR